MALIVKLIRVIWYVCKKKWDIFLLLSLHWIEWIYDIAVLELYLVLSADCLGSKVYIVMIDEVRYMYLFDGASCGI
jgi:hypothetical protein